MNNDSTLAMATLIGAMLDQVDEIALIRAAGGSAQLSQTLLREMSASLAQLDEELQQQFLEMLPAIAAGRAPVTSAVPEREYIASVTKLRRETLHELSGELTAIAKRKVSCN